MNNTRTVRNILLTVMIIFLLVDAVLLAVFLLGRKKADGTDSYEERMETAEEYVSDGDYDQAITVYREAIAIDNSRSDAYYELSDTYVMRADDHRSNAIREIREQGIPEVTEINLQTVTEIELLRYIPEDTMDEIRNDYSEAEKVLEEMPAETVDQDKEKRLQTITEKQEEIVIPENEESNSADTGSSFEDFIAGYTFMAGETFEGYISVGNGVVYEGNRNQDAITWYIYDFDDDGSDELMLLGMSFNEQFSIEIYESDQNGNVTKQAEAELEIPVFVNAEEGHQECFIYQANGRTTIGTANYSLVSYYADGSIYGYEALQYDGTQLTPLAETLHNVGSSSDPTEDARMGSILQQDGIENPPVEDLIFGQAHTSDQVSDAVMIYQTDMIPAFTHEEFSNMYGYNIQDMDGALISEMTTSGNASTAEPVQ